MAGEPLFEFDCDLCDYALGNVRQHLRGIGERPEPIALLRPSELEMLDFPQWFARKLRGDLAPLADRIWAGVFGEVPRTPLSESELYELVDVLDDLPTRLGRTCVWEPYPALHARHVECVAEIRTELTRHTAEAWAEASSGFASQLCARPLSLAEGATVVGEWVGLARRLRLAMGGAPDPVASGVGVVTTKPPRSPRRVRGQRPTEVGGSADANPEVNPEMLSAAAVAARFSLSRSTVYAACRSGLLAHYRVPSTKGVRGKYLVKQADLLAWLETLKSAGESVPSVSAPASSRSALAVPFSELDAQRLERAWKDR
jgi:hypothetical protein